MSIVQVVYINQTSVCYVYVNGTYMSRELYLCILYLFAFFMILIH